MRPEPIEFIYGMPVKAFVRCANEYPYHWHDTLEIIQILKGSVNIGLGNDNLLLRENDIAIANIGELHRMTKGAGEDEILFIHVDADFCRRVLSDRCCSPYHEAQAPEKYSVLKEYIARLVGMLGSGLCGAGQNAVLKLLREMLVLYCVQL